MQDGVPNRRVTFCRLARLRRSAKPSRCCSHISGSRNFFFHHLFSTCHTHEIARAVAVFVQKPLCFLPTCWSQRSFAASRSRPQGYGIAGETRFHFLIMSHAPSPLFGAIFSRHSIAALSGYSEAGGGDSLDVRAVDDGGAESCVFNCGGSSRCCRVRAASATQVESQSRQRGAIMGAGKRREGSG
jgi:hypothetical protein